MRAAADFPRMRHLHVEPLAADRAIARVVAGNTRRSSSGPPAR
jgi:hypothetical protein